MKSSCIPFLRPRERPEIRRQGNKYSGRSLIFPGTLSPPKVSRHRAEKYGIKTVCCTTLFLSLGLLRKATTHRGARELSCGASFEHKSMSCQKMFCGCVFYSNRNLIHGPMKPFLCLYLLASSGNPQVCMMLHNFQPVFKQNLHIILIAIASPKLCLLYCIQACAPRIST